MTNGFPSPECIVEVAGRSHFPVGATLLASRQSPMARLEVLLEPGDISWSDAADAEVRVAMGYEGAVMDVFSGRVITPVPGNPVRLVALDGLHEVKRVTLTTAIVRPTLQDVMDVLLLQAGQHDVVIGSNERQIRVFVAKSIGGLDVIQAVRTSFDVHHWDLYIEPDGTIYFGPWAESPRALAGVQLQLVQGENIESLKLDPRGGSVGTALVPWVAPGHLIEIKDPDVARATITARVERVVHKFAADDGGTTELLWTPV